MPRLFIPPEEIRGRIGLKPRDVRYLVRVLRLEEGDKVVVFDGRGQRYRCRLLEEGGRWSLEVSEELPPEPEPPLRVVLGQGLLKGEKMKWVIQKSTELGVWRIVPLITARSIPIYEEGEVGLKVMRWRRIAEEASKQSNRASVPHIEGPVVLEEFARQAPGLKVALWEGAMTPLREVLSRGERPEEMSVVIGPEGGLSESEAVMLEQEGFSLCSLGPRVLRSETATLAALALLQHLFGDLG